MQEQLKKDIEFCRERKNAHKNVFFKAHEKLQKLYMATLVLPVCSSMVALILSLSKSPGVPKQLILGIVIPSSLSTIVSALYMQPEKVQRVYKNCDAWYDYGNLKARYEKLDANKGFMLDKMTEQSYQKCQKKKLRLATRYPNSMLNE